MRWFEGGDVVNAARQAALMMAAASLAGCFTSRAPLVTAADGVKPFGDGGGAKRVSYSRFGAGPLAETIRFRWTGEAYVVSAGSGGRPETPRYRFAPLDSDWLITQREDGGHVDYGLARKVEDQLYIYAPQCQDLSALDRRILGLELSADGACTAASLRQLRTAMTMLAARNPSPEGYYELLPGGVRP